MFAYPFINDEEHDVWGKKLGFSKIIHREKF
jgi:hypothetical protein